MQIQKHLQRGKVVTGNILSLIGNTPLLKIDNSLFGIKKAVNVYAKLEGFNPGGSIKDRIALQMIESAEKTGELTKDKIIIESTSGNTGIGLAMVAAVKGYKLTIVMPDSASFERRKIMRAYGAKVVLSDSKEGPDSAINKLNLIVEREPEKYFYPNQYVNEQNFMAHYENTAPELIEQSELEGVRIDYFVAGLGTSGTLMGFAKRLKEYNPNIQIVSVEPERKHRVEGLKCLSVAKKPEILDESYIDKRIYVSDEDAKASARRLSRLMGVFVGISSGAAFFGCQKLSQEIKGGNVFTVFPDNGEKYLSTYLCE